MTLRPLRPDDGAHALWARSAPLDPLVPGALAELLRAEPAGLALAAEVGGALAGFGVGVPWGAGRASVRALAVDPAHRRRGVGSAVVGALAEALRDGGATALRLLEASPTYLTPGVDVRDAGALAFAEAAGFRAVGESVNLGVALGSDDWHTEADEVRLADAGIAVRRATLADRDALAAFLDVHWPAWTPEVARALASGTVHLGVRDGRPVGFAAHGAAHPSLARFGPMGTAPETRALGVGAVLLRRGLADLRDAGHARATIAWAAAFPFYERACGATVERRFRRFERSL